MCSRTCQENSTKRYYSEELTQQIIGLYESGLSQTEVATEVGMTRGEIEIFFEKYKQATGYQCRVNTPRPLKGDKNPMWKGGRQRTVQGYVLIHAPNHPHQQKNLVREHVLVVEQALGRYLNYGTNDADSEVVHHINGTRDDNRLENLLLMRNADHASLHFQTANTDRILIGSDGRTFSNLEFAANYFNVSKIFLGTYLWMGWEFDGTLWKYGKPEWKRERLRREKMEQRAKITTIIN